MEHRIYKHSLRIPYADVDQMGVVYYANYFVYFEMARSEMLIEHGMPYSQMEKMGVMLPVVEAHCDYRKPARYEDVIEILTRCTELQGPRLRIEHEVRRGDELLVTGHTWHVCMSPEGKAMRPTPEIRRLVET